MTGKDKMNYECALCLVFSFAGAVSEEISLNYKPFAATVTSNGL